MQNKITGRINKVKNTIIPHLHSRKDTTHTEIKGVRGTEAVRERQGSEEGSERDRRGERATEKVREREQDRRCRSQSGFTLD